MAKRIHNAKIKAEIALLAIKGESLKLFKNIVYIPVRFMLGEVRLLKV